MSAQTAISADPQSEQLQKIWIECLRAVLGQVTGVPMIVEPAEVPPATAEVAPPRPIVWMLFSASKALKGDMAIQTDEAGAMPLAQLLVSEPPDPTAAFDKDHRDAFEELLRQVLGQVATNLKSLAGGEVELKPAGSEAPQWTDATRVGIRVSSEKLEPVNLTLVVSPELRKNLQPAPKTPAVAAPNAEAPAQPIPELSASRNSNLELLLDVKLDATIRFGQKQMLLREVLDLHPGTAVALDRQIEEPVELLIGGRTVARGEVVIVDGNYGLRITEILSPQQRIESLRT